MTTERSPAARSSPGPDHPALAGLNREQRLAVTAPAGPTLVFAGAGSGKTRVITHRIAWRILEHGARPNSILAVTFTNRAAGEMRNRVEELGAQRLGPPPAGETPVRGRPWVATFHAFGLALLRRFGSDVGLPDGFAVLGADDSKALLRRVARELDVSEDLLPPAKLAPLVSRFRTGEASASARRGPRDRRRRDAVRVVADAYGERLAEDGTVDFDDLLIRALELLDRSEPAREFVAWRVGHLLVDEFQDTSPIQYRLVKRLAPHQDVFVVGDDDQSIYSFRGAEFRNILRFARDFDGTRKFTLERNYRSSGSILDAAGAVDRDDA